jgi:hypothetical protein
MRKLLILFVGLSTLFSCEKDEVQEIIKSNPEAPVLTSHVDGFTKEMTKENLSEEMTFEWHATDYGVNTQIQYQLEVDFAGNEFADPKLIGATLNNSLKVRSGDLNTILLVGLKAPSGVVADLELRVVSSVNGGFIQTSPVVNVSIKPIKLFDPENPPLLWVPGGYQGWSPGTAPVIYGVSETEFEGYVYIKEGTGFKFTSHPDWDHINYGDSGTPGLMTTDGLAPGMGASETGYYRFKVNIENLSYEMYRVDNFGMIGTATPGNWDSSTPMAWSLESGVWSATVDLKPGALKFRANDKWDLNYGPEDSELMSGKLIHTDGAISIGEAGSYVVTIDFRKSPSPRYYKYSVVKNVSLPRLWIPGGYQASGGDPSQSDALTLYAVTGSTTEFEGYVSFPSNTWIKFTSSPDWGHTNYGSAGEGTLSTDGAAAGIDVTSGYYKVSVNTAALTYSLVKITTWGLIGTATPGQWDVSTAMNFDAATGKWSKTADLANGALKFRANDAWSVNYGPESDTFSGKLIGTDGAITITESGNYTITIDLSRSQAPFEYTYNVVKN